MNSFRRRLTTNGNSFTHTTNRLKEAKRQNKKAVLNVDRLFIDGTEFKLPDDRMEIGNGNHGRGHGSHTITTPPRLRNNRSNGAWQGVWDRSGGGAAQ